MHAADMWRSVEAIWAGPDGARDAAVLEVLCHAHEPVRGPFGEEECPLYPRRTPVPPEPVRAVVEAASTKDWERVKSLLANEQTAKAFGKYRVALTEAEELNAQRLRRVLWYVAECDRRVRAGHPEAELLAGLAQQFAEILAARWRVDRVDHADVRWPIKHCRRYEYMPTVLREWRVS